MNDISVVIVNFNAGEDLRRCLDSLAAGLAGLSWTGVVVDNQSADGSERAVADFAPPVALVRNAVNVGFGAGVNRGAAATDSRLLLVINPDCRLFPGSVARLGRELDAHSRCAVVAPAILNEDGTLQGNARGDPTMFTGLFGRSTLLRRVFPGSKIARRNVVTTAGAGESSVAVDWVSGACMLVRRDVFERCGGFDERYFLYWEDADLCRRIRSEGFEIRYHPVPAATHVVARCSRADAARATREFHRSAYRYYRTHVGRTWLHPGRWTARPILGIRCWWQLRKIRTSQPLD